MPGRFLFVGECPSNKARAYGHTWENGKAAAYTLHNAIRACGLDPGFQEYCNLWEGDRRTTWPDLYTVRQRLDEGFVIVGMGQRVQRVLKEVGIPHLPMIHPAARGKVRKREVYQAHVREVLGGNG